MDKALSVVIPAYNAEAFIEGTLQSLLKQNSEQMEIIVVDDGSRDATGDIVRRIMDEGGYDNLHLHTQENGGVSTARNAGLLLAKGAYVFFLDADDYVSDSFVPPLLKLIQDTQADVIHWPYDLVDEKGNVLQGFPYPQVVPPLRTGAETLRAILLDKTTRVSTGSVAYRRDLLLNHSLQYTQGCTAGEDVEFNLCAISHATQVLYAPQLRNYYIRHASSVMNSYSIKKFSAVEAMERVGVYFRQRGQAAFDKLAEHMDDYETLHSYAGTYTMCLRHLIQAENMQPRAAMARLGQEIDGMFPGMRGSINGRLKARKKKFPPDRIDVFRFSPLLYLYLSNQRQPVAQKSGGL